MSPKKQKSNKDEELGYDFEEDFYDYDIEDDEEYSDYDYEDFEDYEDFDDYENFEESIDKWKPEEAYSILFRHLKSLLPAADDSDITRFLG